MVRPKSTREVQAVLRFSRIHRVPVVPFGGGSGLMGGAATVREGIVLDLRSMSHVLKIDKESLTATVEPGITWSSLTSHLSPLGLEAGHDPWTVAVATVGGAVSTNGYGYLAGRYGSAGDQVIGLETVLADGTGIRSRPARKRSVGPDLDRLFIGSEGTLGVITQCTLAVHPIPAVRIPALYTFPDFEAGYRAVLALFASGLVPTSLDLSVDHWPEASSLPVHGLTGSRTHAATLLIVFDGHESIVSAQHQLARELLTTRGATPEVSAAAQNQWDQRHAIAELWASSPEARDGAWLRDLSPRATCNVPRATIPSFDYLHVCLPPSRLLEFRRVARSLLITHHASLLQEGIWIRPDFYSIIMLAAGRDARRTLDRSGGQDVRDGGESADGPRAPQRMRSSREALIRLAHKMGGSMEYVHGVGLHLKKHMPAEWGAGLSILRGLKKQLDPLNLLNPGKLF
ncbi:MAG: FAD-binding oxidoreductase [Nitrospirae bacterium]|nr:FAD-binding oxidoreductase [Nitrospirota bacterium]